MIAVMSGIMLKWLKHLVSRYRKSREEKYARQIDELKGRYHIFRSLLANNAKAIDLIAGISLSLYKLRSDHDLPGLLGKIINETGEMVQKLNMLDPGTHRSLFNIHRNISLKLENFIKNLSREKPVEYCLALDSNNEPNVFDLGNKAANLMRLKKDLGIPVPDGFVITTHACRLFLEYKGLSMKIFRTLNQNIDKIKSGLSPKFDELQELIIEAELPPVLEGEFKSIYEPFYLNEKPLAIRSSSTREDSPGFSFAGQFNTVLNVTNHAQFINALKEVIASSFNSWNQSYQIQAGLDPVDSSMSILCLEMIEARKAGIIFSRDPVFPEGNTMVISAVYGLGKPVSDGSASSDLYYVDQSGKIDWQRSIIADKVEKLVSSKEGGLKRQKIKDEKHHLPVLTEDEIRELTQWATKLEQHEKAPQDIEWAIDEKGKLYILQVRMILYPGIKTKGSKKTGEIPLLSGTVASAGSGCGRVRLITNPRQLNFQPDEPLVLVMHQSFVEASSVLPFVQAMLVELGSPVDHLSCVARENGIPMICTLKNVGQSLQEGQWIKINETGEVYSASKKEIENAKRAWGKNRGKQITGKNLPDESRKIQGLVTNLNLTDAYGPTFSILECQSLHDIVRFVHEKAVLAMFDTGDAILEDCPLNFVQTIDSPFPFLFSIIDIGGGLAFRKTRKKRVPAQDIISRPFQAIWKGMATEGLSWGPKEGAKIGSVFSTWITDQKSCRPVGMPNYAIIGRDYCNINARMDFHFTMIDAVSGLDPRNNHIKFRFKGGGAQVSSRHRRVRCIAKILEYYGFLTEFRADLVTGSIQGGSGEIISEKLEIIGRLLGFTRLLDAVMVDETKVDQVFNAFKDGNYSLKNIQSLSL